MKTNIFNITALALLITTGFIATSNTTIKNALKLRGESTNVTTVMDNNHVNYVKAEMVGGELMPVVDLPEFNVIGEYNENTRVKAKYVNGELMAVVDLPELTIEG